MSDRDIPWHDYLGITGSGLGGIGALAALGLASGPAAAAAFGATGLGLVGYGAGRLIRHLIDSETHQSSSWEDDSDHHAALALRRLSLDFTESPLGSPSSLRRGLSDSITKLRWARLVARSADPRLHTSFHIPTSSFSSVISPAAIKLLRAATPVDSVISIRGPSIGVAAQVVCHSLAASRQLPIDYDFSMAHGFDVIQQVISRASPPDFLVLSDGSFFLAGHKLHRQYVKVLPLHTDSQYLAIAKSNHASNIRRILCVPGTASELQALSGYGLPSRVETKHIDAADVPALLRSESCKATGALVWDALMTGVLRTPGAIMSPGSDAYSLWTSLYAHQDWLRPARLAVLEAFLEAWVAEWNFCRSKPDLARLLLLGNEEFLVSFGAGCGLPPRGGKLSHPVPPCED